MVPSLSSFERNTHNQHTLFSSRDRIILIVLKTLTILAVTVISILVATGACPLTGASIAVPVSIFSIWFLGITLLFFINKRELSQFSSFNETKLIFSQRQKDLIKWGISQKSFLLRESEDAKQGKVLDTVTISISPYLSPLFPKEEARRRVKMFQEDFRALTQKISLTSSLIKSEHHGFLDCLEKELLYLFAPSSYKPNITPRLSPCKDSIVDFSLAYSLSDVLCFCFDNPETWDLLTQKIFEGAAYIHNEFVKNKDTSLTLKDSIIYICRILNTWLLGKTLEEGTIESILNYNPKYLSKELKEALFTGNLCKFIIQKSSAKDETLSINFLRDPEDLELLSAKRNEVLNLSIFSREKKRKELFSFKQNLISKLSIYRSLSSPQSRLYAFNLWKNKDALVGLYDFIKTNHKTIVSNPSILLEILNADLKLQEFVRDFLSSGFNFEKMKKLIRPIILGGISSRVFTKKDIQLFCNRFGLNEASFLKSISEGTFLELLFPNLFKS
ncbi:CT214 family putative inclusion membrane protein [Chlamydiifrater volucris]|uniref:CT214 family putative inclusion membrane protein n=1 Tax=Chlamydiifrater volucris TaxID=2681470 RepID=UPI001BCCAF65|nr:hypothetical protein [Chlamydiifrater volucris]